jgi:dTDP-glucose 4,6-dehydratase
MKHIIFGGDGFLGTDLTRKLIEKGENVLILDLKKKEENTAYSNNLVEYQYFDVTKSEQFSSLNVEARDYVYHFAAKLLVPIVPRKKRKDYFWQALNVGTKNVLDFMIENRLDNLVYFTTDMVYGKTVHNPRFEDHPRVPIGPYGEAKYQTELLCEEYRKRGINISIFRPRLIIGPGRLGILEKLFKLVDKNLPVPTIGNGKNYYQFISVNDCAEACIAATRSGFPNEEFNLGSDNPPTVNELLGTLIKHSNSKSMLIPTPAFMVKWALGFLDVIGASLMDPEQYIIADETCVLDCSKASEMLSWRATDSDEDMLVAAYDSYHTAMD